VYSGSKAGDLPSPNFTPLGIPTQVSYYVPAYTLWNLNVTYRWRRTTFALFVDNLFDKKGITQVGGIGGLGLSPAWRRNVRFSTSFEF
jgi:outer membrane receptor protein involved in Fe transport